MTYLTYTNTYENVTDFEFNVDISIKSGEMLEQVQNEFTSLTYIGESLETISYQDKTIEFELFYDPDDNNQEYIFEIETYISPDEQLRKVTLTFCKIELLSLEKQELIKEQKECNLINFYI